MQKAKKNGFPGGVHPTDGYDKALTMDLPVRVYQPETVAILAEQSFGGVCSFLVKKGDTVTCGQLIGEPASFKAAPLHASVSGQVLDVCPVADRGREATACIVKAGQHGETADGAYRSQIMDISSFTRENIIAGLRDGGLTGLGGAGFPTHKKYETTQPIDALLINGAECEPFLTCDYRLMVEETCAVLNGVLLMKKASGASRVCICVEDNKPQAISALSALVDGKVEGVEVVSLPTKYPQGGERQLIQSVLDREVPMGGLPADVGVIVSNVGTAKAAADMILGGAPLTSRMVTVTGCVKEPGNVLVPIGTSARELIQLCGGVTSEKNRVIEGGPMTGTCHASDWNGETELFYVTKSTSGIVVLPESHHQESPCIRCGGCEQVCPVGLSPYAIDFALRNEDYGLCEELYATECIACGCCSFTCPAKRELSVRTAMARDLVRQKMRERAAKQ